MLATVRRHAALVLPIVAMGGLAGVVHGEPGPQMRDACEVLGLCPGAPIPAQATLHEPNLPAPEPKLTHL